MISCDMITINDLLLLADGAIANVDVEQMLTICKYAFLSVKGLHEIFNDKC